MSDTGSTPPPRPTAEQNAVPPAGSAAPAAAPTAPGEEPLDVRRTRTSAAYVGMGVGLLVLILVIIFIVQNLHDDSVHFITASFRLPMGVIILISAVAGALIVLFVSLARVAQLRLAARRHRRLHRQQAGAS